MERSNAEFPLQGVNHVALVCSDMAETVAFYNGVLGMPLTKTINIPGGGQHFFFDIGNGDHLAFFWFPNAPKAAPGIAAPAAMPAVGDITTAHGSMNHLSFNVPLDTFTDCRERLIEKGVDVSMILDHDDSPSTVAPAFHDGVYVRSFYFQGPDGVLLEFASWTRELTDGDADIAPFDHTGNSVTQKNG